MNANEALKDTLEGLKPMLDAADREINIMSATDTSCIIELKGFCEGCDCTQNYVEGIQEILAEKAPQVKDITFIQSCNG